MKYKLAVFDMDGTILDTLSDLTDSCNFALRENGLPERSIDEVKRFVGNGIKKLIERAVPQGTDVEKTEAVFNTFAAYYKDHSAIKTKPYDGIPELIKKLRDNGVLTAVVSNKADFAVQDLCMDYFPGAFDIAIGENEKAGIKKKPARDMVDLALSKLGMTKEDAVYIGDSDVDYDTAKNSELDVIMVGWGFRDKEELFEKGARFVIDRPDEIAEIIINDKEY